MTPPGPRPKRPPICLAASGGGHIRQLLDLEPAWKERDHFFVTDPTALGRSIAEDHRTYFVSHVALGQARLGAPGRMIAAGIRNFVQSARAILRERPNVVLTTGAGTVFFAVLLSRLLGARVILIESFARFDSPSIFARIASRFSSEVILQSNGLSAYWPRARVFDPFRLLSDEPPRKEALAFVTVGATLPFDRLVRSVANLKARGLLPERTIAQVGEGGIRPPELECVETMSFDEIQATLARADIVFCHGGTGSLITALRQGCRIVAVARRYDLGEGYDHHQEQIIRAFAGRELIVAADSEEDFAEAVNEVRRRSPKIATTDSSALASYLLSILEATESPRLRPARKSTSGGRRS